MTVRPKATAPTPAIVTPYGCVLLPAKSGRCHRYFSCAHAASCCGLAATFTKQNSKFGGFYTYRHDSPGFKQKPNPWVTADFDAYSDSYSAPEVSE